MKISRLVFAVIFFFQAQTIFAFDTIKIAIAGDSLACQYFAPSTTEGWGMEMPNLFNATINNFAASGSSTKSFFNGSSAVDGIPSGQPNSIHRWENLLASNPNYVFISFGWNDSYMGDPERYCTISEFQSNLKKMIDDTREIGAVPLLITTPTNRGFLPGGYVNNAIRPYCDAMIQAANEKSAAFVDLNAALVNTYQIFGPNYTPLFGYTPSDILHFGKYGAETVASLIINDMQTALPELSQYFDPNGNQLVFSNNGSELVFTPTHESIINSPVLLEDDVTINTSSSVHFNGGIKGSKNLTIVNGTIFASGIETDTLTIGGALNTVPEPNVIIIMASAMAFALALFPRKK